jgi:CrcB protein
MSGFHWQTVLFVAIGGGLGSVTRYSLTLMSNAWFGPGFPTGTLLVNTLGAGLIGFLAAVLSTPAIPSEALRAGILIGFLGGLTTFSTFAADTITLADTHHWGMSVVNVILNNSAAIGCALLGIWLARRWGYVA